MFCWYKYYYVDGIKNIEIFALFVKKKVFKLQRENIYLKVYQSIKNKLAFLSVFFLFYVRTSFITYFIFK